MKKTLSTVGLLLILSLFSFSILAQNDLQTFLVFEDNVLPGKEKEYVQVAKQQVELFKKYDFKFPFYVHSTSDNLYYWVVPVENLAMADDVFKEFETWGAKLKENNETDIHKAYKGKYDHMMVKTIVWSSELSYKPTVPRLKEGERAFVRWWFCYLYPGEDSEFYNKQVKYVDFFKKANAITGFDTYWGMMGTEMPLIIYIERYKDEMDMLTTRDELFNSLDPKVSELWEDMKQHIRKVEIKTGWFRPNLSYMPEN